MFCDGVWCYGSEICPESLLEVDLEWRRGRFGGRTRDCGTAGVRASGAKDTGGRGPKGTVGTGGFACNIGVVGEPGEKFSGVLLPCEGVVERPPDGEYVREHTQANSGQLKTSEDSEEEATQLVEALPEVVQPQEYALAKPLDLKSTLTSK